MVHLRVHFFDVVYNAVEVLVARENLFVVCFVVYEFVRLSYLLVVFENSLVIAVVLVIVTIVDTSVVY